jgi:hypothetical protein
MPSSKLMTSLAQGQLGWCAKFSRAPRHLQYEWALANSSNETGFKQVTNNAHLIRKASCTRQHAAWHASRHSIAPQGCRGCGHCMNRCVQYCRTPDRPVTTCYTVSSASSHTHIGAARQHATCCRQPASPSPGEEELDEHDPKSRLQAALNVRLYYCT